MAGPDTSRMETRPALGVRPVDAQRLRMLLAARIDKDAQPRRDDGRVWFPLRPGEVEEALSVAAAAGIDVAARERPFQTRTRRPSHYSDLVEGLSQEERDLLPSSFDVVGHVAVLKLPEPLVPHAERIGLALCQAHPRIATVALDRGVRGDLRVRDLQVVFGETALQTVHREHGLDLEVALDKVYFSPRLATERARLAERVAPGARIVDLFAGVGAFVCLVARERAPKEIVAIDLNPEAVALLRRNLERNHVTTPVVVAEGDARDLAPRTGDWDHVVMNLPHDAVEFLDVAAACVAPDGEVHLYAMVERDEHDAVVRHLERRMSDLKGTPWHVVDERHVRNYSPTMDGLGFTLAAVDHAAVDRAAVDRAAADRADAPAPQH